MYVYPTGDSVQTGDIINQGQSPIGGCVFKQMSPLVGYKCTHTNTSLFKMLDTEAHKNVKQIKHEAHNERCYSLFKMLNCFKHLQYLSQAER